MNSTHPLAADIARSIFSKWVKIGLPAASYVEKGQKTFQMNGQIHKILWTAQ